MKAVIIDKPCPAKDLTLTDIPVPEVKPGWILIRVEAFGINHSEVLLRKFEVAQSYIKKPIVPGIECIGVIADPSDSNFKPNQKVMAFMGGMGRSFNGSYALYVLMPTSHVFKIDSKLSIEDLAAIPETYYTAYGSLTLSLQLKAGEILLIRGGTSTVGVAALQLAKAMGAQVISTTRSEAKAKTLLALGADDVLVEGEDFRRRFLEKYPYGATKVLELLGAKTLRESLHLTATHGIICHTGLLGGVYGLERFDPIKEIPSGVYLTGFYSNQPTQSQIDSMMRIIKEHNIKPLIAQVFSLENIAAAHELAETREQLGKIVVTI